MRNAGFDYTALGLALDELRSALTPSEFHGGLCGTLCAGEATAVSGWIDACIDESDAGPMAADDARRVFDELEREAWRALASSDLEFEPLLPDDDAPLEERISEVASWCHGFLAGLALGGVRDADLGARAGGEATVEEIVQDFSAFSRAAVGAAERDDPDAAGFALAEIVEYIRAGVQIVFEDIGAARAAAGGVPVSMSEH